MSHNESIEKLVSHLFRQEAGKMTAILIRLFGFSMISLAEDIVQDTFLSAYTSWPYGDIPDKPEAWLMQVAKNKAINALKREARNISLPNSVFVSDKENSLTQYIEQAFTEKDTLDAQLKLLFLCCHPQLNEKQQIALTLQVLSGFSLQEISSALLMEKEAVKKTLFRAKQEIKDKGLSAYSGYTLLSMQRQEMVRHVLYLMFNEGYKTTESKELINIDLCFEAIRLGKIVLASDNDATAGETQAMLSLMFFNVARFSTRTNTEGGIISLEKQDRSLWDNALINEGYYYLNASRNSTTLTRYHLEAGIAALHCSAESFEQTNWQQVLFYYDQLIKIDSSPIIILNRAVAVYHVHGVSPAMKELERIKNTRLGNYYLFHATKAAFLVKAGQHKKAIQYYRQAINLANSTLDKQFLYHKIEECRSMAN